MILSITTIQVIQRAKRFYKEEWERVRQKPTLFHRYATCNHHHYSNRKYLLRIVCGSMSSLVTQWCDGRLMQSLTLISQSITDTITCLDKASWSSCAYALPNRLALQLSLKNWFMIKKIDAYYCSVCNASNRVKKA